MAKQMTWRKKDLQNLTKAVRKFNTSVTKFATKHPELADAGLVPPKYNAGEIRASDLTRKDFNNILKAIDRWFQKGARDIITKGGIKMTRWDYNETRYANYRLTYYKRQRLKKSPTSIQQSSAPENKIKSVSQKLSEMEKALNDKSRNNYNDIENMQQSWLNFRKRVMKQSTEEYQEKMSALYYYNYNKSIYENFSDENARLISDVLEQFNLSGYELYEITGKYPELDIEFMYSRQEEEAKLEYWLEMFPRAVADLRGYELGALL